jgi:type VI secretion system protein
LAYGQILFREGSVMSLCLTITSYHKITPGQCFETTLDSGEMTIGRGLDNDWVLADPARLISSRHCVIKYVNGGYFVTDNSTNGVELLTAGICLRRGNSEPLHDGEVVRIGDYEITVRINANTDLSDSALLSVGATQGFDALIAPSQHLPSAIAGGADEVPIQDTVSDLFSFLNPASVPPQTVSDHVPVERHDFSPPATPIAFAPPMNPDPAADANSIPADWDFSVERPVAAVGKRDQLGDKPHSPLLSALIQPQTAPVAAGVIPSPATDTRTDDPLQAFLRGAGLEHLKIDDAELLAHMQVIGRSYRRMVEGLIDILRARSTLKGEFRMQQTLIRPLENNPLKFAPNADEALLLLMRQGNQAFMDPVQAIDDSFNDLRAHQLAVMAGVEASIQSLLKRFEPACLEARMASPGPLTQLFGSHSARCWRLFTELYTDISREAEDDFSELFGREFGRAYEQHSAQTREC